MPDATSEASVDHASTRRVVEGRSTVRLVYLAASVSLREALTTRWTVPTVRARRRIDDKNRSQWEEFPIHSASCGGPDSTVLISLYLRDVELGGNG